MDPRLRRQLLYPELVPDSEIIIPGKRRANPNAEWRLQAKCATLIRKVMRHDPDLRFIATLPEGHRDRARAAIAKMMGLQPGVADLLLLRRHGQRLRVCWVELKRSGRRGNLSDAQAEWLEWLPADVQRHVCDDVDEFRRILAGF